MSAKNTSGMTNSLNLTIMNVRKLSEKKISNLNLQSLTFGLFIGLILIKSIR